MIIGDNTLLVNPGKYLPVDFNRNDAIATCGLEACVAVVTYTPQQGSIGHLKNNSNLDAYYRWLKENINLKSKTYIVGGMDNKSKELASRLEERVLQARLDLVGKDILGTQMRNILLNKKGELYIEFFITWMDGAKVLQEITQNIKEVQL